MNPALIIIAHNFCWNPIESVFGLQLFVLGFWCGGFFFSPLGTADPHIVKFSAFQHLFSPSVICPGFDTLPLTEAEHLQFWTALLLIGSAEEKKQLTVLVVYWHSSS